MARGRRGELRSTRPSVYTVIDHIRRDIIVSLHFNTQYRLKLLEYTLIREDDIIILSGSTYSVQDILKERLYKKTKLWFGICVKNLSLYTVN